MIIYNGKLDNETTSIGYYFFNSLYIYKNLLCNKDLKLHVKNCRNHRRDYVYSLNLYKETKQKCHHERKKNYVKNISENFSRLFKICPKYILPL